MQAVEVVIIGAGQAGLAMSWHLRQRSIDHVVLERSSVAHSWANERWDSLRLLTPNWLSRLPGSAYGGDEPDGYMAASDVAEWLRVYGSDAPVREQAPVHAVRTVANGFEVHSTGGAWSCSSVVVATGACGHPFVPALAGQFPTSTQQLTPIEYRNPDQLVAGPALVVGASASGAQLADELARHGKDVTLAVGRHRRMIRRYRGHDIFWWMDRIGMLDDAPDPLDRGSERRLPSLQLVGSDEYVDLNLHTLVANGVRPVGRIESITGTTAQLGTSVADDARDADVEIAALLDRIDRFADHHDLDVGPIDRPLPVELPAMPEQLDIAPFTAVIWATGFCPSYPWLEQDLLDDRGAVIHDKGVMARPGMYVTGQPFGLRRRSGFIDGAGPDAEDLALKLAQHLNRDA